MIVSVLFSDCKWKFSASLNLPTPHFALPTNSDILSAVFLTASPIAVSFSISLAKKSIASFQTLAPTLAMIASTPMTEAFNLPPSFIFNPLILSDNSLAFAFSSVVFLVLPSVTPLSSRFGKTPSGLSTFCVVAGCLVCLSIARSSLCLASSSVFILLVKLPFNAISKSIRFANSIASPPLILLVFPSLSVTTILFILPFLSLLIDFNPSPCGFIFPLTKLSPEYVIEPS